MNIPKSKKNEIRDNYRQKDVLIPNNNNFFLLLRSRYFRAIFET